MKLEFKIRVNIDDKFEERIGDKDGLFTPEFRSHFLGYLGHLMKVTKEDDAKVESFIIKKLAPDTPKDEDIEKDISGDAVHD